MKEKKTVNNKSGITLIALVVTIIVLLILAGISIMMLSGQNGILVRSKDAKEETVVGTEKEQVELAYVNAAINELGGIVTEENLRDELDKILGDTDKNEENKKTTVESVNDLLYVTFDETGHYYEVKNGKAEKIKEIPEYTGIILTSENAKSPEVTYTDASGNPKSFNEEVQNGDIVIYGDYEYHYNQSYTKNPFRSGWDDDEIDGWGVTVIDRDKEEVGELCGSIFGKSVISMNMTFGSGASGGGSKIIVAPNIPSSVIYMGGTFQNCYGLTTLKSIPSSVKEMDYIFGNCESLTGTITIDANPDIYNSWIYGNKELKIKGKSTMLQELALNHTNITIIE